MRALHNSVKLDGDDELEVLADGPADPDPRRARNGPAALERLADALEWLLARAVACAAVPPDDDESDTPWE